MPLARRAHAVVSGRTILAVGIAALGLTVPADAAPVGAATPAASSPPTARVKPVKPDLSGQKRVGKASFYARTFTGRKMADGARMDPHDDNAASKTLPLGTTAKVTNLETGRTATVTIQDRGPYVAGRIIDLSPSTAQKVGITRENGVAQVEVAPIAVPQPDGSVKPGAAAEPRR